MENAHCKMCYDMLCYDMLFCLKKGEIRIYTLLAFVCIGRIHKRFMKIETYRVGGGNW